MAPQAKNELGQLFIDFGTKGFPTLLKSLNTVSAQFLLGKNAANQFVQTLTKPFKEAGNSAVEIGKMSNALATSSVEYQKLAMYLKKYNLSDSLLGDVNKLEQTFYDISQAFIDIPDSIAVAFNQLGLGINNYRGTFQDTIKLFDDLQKATANLSKEKRNQIFRQMGISTDWGYLFDKGGRASDFATISDGAIKANQSLQESMNELKNTFDVFTKEVLAEFAPYLKSLADSLSEWTKRFLNNGGANTTANVIKNTAPGAAVGGVIGGPAGAVVGATANWQGKKILESGGLYTGTPFGGLGYQYKSKGKTTGQAADLGYIGELPTFGGAELPPNLSNMVQNITNNITHDITINGNNASEIADRIASISSEDIQYTQYQANNLAGL